MKKQIFLTLLVSIFTLGAQAQWRGSKNKIKGNNNKVTIDRKTSDYDKIHLKGSWDVKLIKGTEGNLTITGESNLLEYIVTEVEGDKLIIHSKNGYSLSTSFGETIVVSVPFSDLDGIYLSGSGDIEGEDTVIADDLDIVVSGSGDIAINLQATNLKSKVTGSGDVLLKGEATAFECSVTGSGDISAYGVTAKNVEASVTGSGDIAVTATESIKGRVTGSGDIDFKGNPITKDTKVLGSGDITAN
ncbi:DUF2807 domain-containing protein [Aquimarina sp. ERC-38]|uniref:head GIN domain-containing protein n=1 Tax=Aquimarina sp. ERC-38 TaxID=2949996 RepID=UPI002247945B|nr:head GIN domain-containing protein [Aquimarina sp. ERC-38]UZO80226.1 DUF2807 domain-containing protein [Aquimarina sp. ERC-38]